MALVLDQAAVKFAKKDVSGMQVDVFSAFELPDNKADLVKLAVPCCFKWRTALTLVRYTFWANILTWTIQSQLLIFFYLFLVVVHAFTFETTGHSFTDMGWEQKA